MFGIGTTELIIVLIIVLLIFGVGKIPKLGKSLGEGIQNFRKSVKGDDEEEQKPEDRQVIEMSGRAHELPPAREVQHAAAPVAPPVEVARPRQSAAAEPDMKWPSDKPDVPSPSPKPSAEMSWPSENDE